MRTYPERTNLRMKYARTCLELSRTSGEIGELFMARIMLKPGWLLMQNDSFVGEL